MNRVWGGELSHQCTNWNESILDSYILAHDKSLAKFSGWIARSSENQRILQPIKTNFVWNNWISLKRIYLKEVDFHFFPNKAK